MSCAEINKYGQILTVTGRFWPVIFVKIVIQIGSREMPDQTVRVGKNVRSEIGRCQIRPYGTGKMYGQESGNAETARTAAKKDMARKKCTV